MHFRVKMCVSMLAMPLCLGVAESQRGAPGQAACRFFERPEQRCRTAGPDAPHPTKKPFERFFLPTRAQKP